jgi:hypothetical protein
MATHLFEIKNEATQTARTEGNCVTADFVGFSRYRLSLYVTIHVTTSRDTRDYARSPVKVAIARGSRIEWDSCPGAGLRNFRIAGNPPGTFDLNLPNPRGVPV